MSSKCVQCGAWFDFSHYANRHGRSHKAAPAKYCSALCRKHAWRERHGQKPVPAVPATDAQARSVPRPQSHSARSSSGPVDSFERLRGGAVLSQWVPVGDGKDMPDIPEFLRRGRRTPDGEGKFSVVGGAPRLPLARAEPELEAPLRPPGIRRPYG